MKVKFLFFILNIIYTIDKFTIYYLNFLLIHDKYQINVSILLIKFY